MRDPEAIFYRFSQDNDVLLSFQYHSMRVMFLASALARRVGCYDEDLRVAALLHDIGKIGIAKEILLKPAKLNELEYVIVQSHCHIGNTIVRKYLGMTRAASFVRDHHERWDGKGYPRGLAGEKISEQGRIINICDSFDTMTVERRSYQMKPMLNEEAFQELREQAWKQFDGRLVDVFIDMMQDIKLPKFLIPTFKHPGKYLLHEEMDQFIRRIVKEI